MITDSFLQFLRWTARIIGSMIALLMIVVVVGEGVWLNQISMIQLLMSTALAVSWVGLLIGWKWEGFGGTLVLSGLAAFYLLNLSESGSFPSGWPFPSIAFPGILYILCYISSPKAHSQITP